MAEAAHSQPPGSPGSPAWLENVLQTGPSSGPTPGQPLGKSSSHRTYRAGASQRRKSSIRMFSIARLAGSTRSLQTGHSASGMWGGGAAAKSHSHDAPLHVPDEQVMNSISEDQLKAHVLSLNTLPTELAEVLRRYDLDDNGILDRQESIHAAADLARMRHQIEQGIVHLHAFPEVAQPMLERHDLDCDGTLDVSEMIIAFEALERERKGRKMWMNIAFAAFLFIALMILSSAGMLYYILGVTRDSDIVGNVMVVKDGTEPVRTASLELAVKNGVLMDRGSSCAGEQECPIQVAEANEKRRVSSALPDAELNELKQLRISSADAWLQLRVFGVQRQPAPASQHGSLLILYTHVGQAVLDGSTLQVDAALSTVLAKSGFYVDISGGGRLLRDDVELLGTFNSVSSSGGASR